MKSRRTRVGVGRGHGFSHLPTVRMAAADLAPTTAILLVGQAKLMSVCRCLGAHDSVGAAVRLQQMTVTLGTEASRWRIRGVRSAGWCPFVLRRGRAAHRGVDEEDERDVVGVAQPDEAGGLLSELSVSRTPPHDGGLVGHDAHGSAVDAGEAGDHVGGVQPPISWNAPSSKTRMMISRTS